MSLAAFIRPRGRRRRLRPAFAARRVSPILAPGERLPAIATITDEAKIVVDNVLGTIAGGGTPTVRLGVTGLSRAGKTVFITALVHNLVHGGRLPLFEAYAERPARRGAADAAARRRRAALRLRGACARPGRESASGRIRRGASASCASSSNTNRRATLKRTLGRGRLNLDIVDYPGEWLLDLALLKKILCGVVGRGARAVARAASRRRSPRIGMRCSPSVDAGRAGGRGDGARAGRGLHALSARRARRRACALDAAAGPLPDARRPRGLARADLRAARHRRGSFGRGRTRSPR